LFIFSAYSYVKVVISDNKQPKHIYVRKQLWFRKTVCGQTQTRLGAISAAMNVKYGW